jgi:hypothetical protein
MARVSIQFHAMPLEVAEFLVKIASDSSLRFTALGGNPFTARPWAKDVSSIADNESDISAIAVTLAEPSLSGRSIHEFHKSNAEILAVEIGRATESGLKESWLWATSNDPPTLKVWKRLAGRLTALCTTGGFAENLNTGARGSAGNHRFSSGARLAHSNGMRLLPVAGHVEFHPT